MKNPNLTPVVITDKRGRTTTVHRRTMPRTAPKMPSPERPIINPNSTPEFEEFKPLGRAAFLAIKDRGPLSTTAVQNLTCIAMHDESLMHEIVERCNRDGLEGLVWRQNISHTSPFYVKDPFMNPRVIAQYREALELFPLATQIAGSESVQAQLPTSVNAVIAETKVHVADRYGEKVDYDVEMMKAYMVACSIERVPTGSNDDDSAAMLESVTFIRDNFDAVMDKLPSLIARGNRDAGLMEQIILSETPALTDGIL
jgi:hypothetical protein